MNDKTDLSAIKDEALREAVVVMYGCTPTNTLPDFELPRVEKDELPVLPKQRVEVDIDQVQEIASEIKQKKKELEEIDNIVEHSKLLIVDTFDDVNHKELFLADKDTDIAKGIVELIRSYYENEIERLNNELIKLITG